jgi:UDP-N-acetyl-2-amino-2-deoxyglucuronate dehydrogenase
MKNFALIGASGYVASRHLQAIKETGNILLAALDKSDCAGILDSYFPNADFFVEFERFDRHLDKLRRKGDKVDYVSICTPNYLHDSHIRFSLRQNADAICEKPIVLNPWNAEALMQIEKETGKKVYNILQLRLHPSIIALKEKIAFAPKDKIFEIDLTYLTSRGKWYFISWKGDVAKSGGIATNIGVHFYDMLGWIFGKVTKNVVNVSQPDMAAGYMEFERAKVRWLLSVDYNMIPEKIKAQGKRTYRSLKMDGEEIEFSDGFTDLHTRSYQEILKGNGFGLEDAMQSIQTVFEIRNAEVVGLKGEYHPMLKDKK